MHDENYSLIETASTHQTGGQRIQLWLCIVGVVCGVVFSPSLAFPATEASTAAKQYGGYTLEEWRYLIKNTDFRTLADPRYLQGLKEIIVDVEAPWASRKQAGETLGRIGEPAESAVPLLQQILRDPHVDEVNTRLWVLKSLSLFDTVAQAASRDVQQLILDPDQPHLVRMNSLETLGRIGRLGEIALPTFLSILQQPPTKAEQGVRHADHQHDELRVAAADALWLLGPLAAPALPALIEAAREEWSPMRLAAITSIGQIGSSAEIAIPLLVDTILFDDAGEVREAAADALGKIGSAAISALLQLQEDNEEEVRRLVIRASAQMGDSPEIRKVLLRGLEDESSLVNVEAANEFLKRDGSHSAAVETVLELLGSSQRRPRLSAYQIVYRHLPTSPTLQRALQERVDDPGVTPLERSAARKLLRKLQFDQVTPQDSPAAPISGDRSS